MKHLLIILTIIFFSHSANAQQTEDEVYIGKGKTFGNYQGTSIIIPDFGKNIKPITGRTSITGLVVGYCKKDCCYKKINPCSVDVQVGDSLVTIGTRDFGFTVPKEIVGHKIIVEGKDAGQISGDRKRRGVNKLPQQDIHFAATGLKVID